MRSPSVSVRSDPRKCAVDGLKQPSRRARAGFLEEIQNPRQDLRVGGCGGGDAAMPGDADHDGPRLLGKLSASG